MGDVREGHGDRCRGVPSRKEKGYPAACVGVRNGATTALQSQRPHPTMWAQGEERGWCAWVSDANMTPTQPCGSPPTPAALRTTTQQQVGVFEGGAQPLCGQSGQDLGQVRLQNIERQAH